MYDLLPTCFGRLGPLSRSFLWLQIEVRKGTLVRVVTYHLPKQIQKI